MTAKLDNSELVQQAVGLVSQQLVDQLKNPANPRNVIRQQAVAQIENEL